MDEQKQENTQPTPEQPAPEQPPVDRRTILRRWGGLVLGTLVLIACSLLAAEALKRVVTVQTVYDEVITVDLDDLYGTWRFAEVSHVYIAISVSEELVAEHLSGTVMDISEQHFLATGGVEWYVKNPRYVLHALEDPTGALDDVQTMLGEEVLGYYAVLSEGGTVQPYRIYFSRDHYWATETHEQADGLVVLDTIFRIERAD